MATTGFMGEFDDLDSFFSGTFCDSALAMQPLSSCEESKDTFSFDEDLSIPSIPPLENKEWVYMSDILKMTDQPHSEPIVHYLMDPSRELTIVILHSKVAQRSYGFEKRFLTPQPMVLLLGDWPTAVSIKAECVVDEPIIPDQTKDSSSKKKQKNETVPSFSISLVSCRSSLPGRLDLLSDTSFYRNHLGVEGMFQKCVFKSIYAPSCIKKKEFKLNFELDLSFYGLPSRAESFPSHDIKVISKPLKKATTRSLDCKSLLYSIANHFVKVNVFSGSLVALYNRIKSQTVTTRYLGMEGSPAELISKTNEWDVFSIWLSSDPRMPKPYGNISEEKDVKIVSSYLVEENTGLHEKSIDIFYGSSIVLQHVKTGYMTKPMMIYQCIDKNILEMCGKTEEFSCSNPGFHVCQLHKIALLNNFGFLSHSNGHIGTEMPAALNQGFSPRLLQVEESCIWTLCGVDKVEFTFHVPRHLNGETVGLHPFPRMTGIHSHSKTQLTISGDNLDGIDIYFGSFKAVKVVYKSKNYLIVDIPTSLTLIKGAFPILLVKTNGIIYRTGFHVNY